MKSLQKILAVDIGAGTQDILLYDASLAPENCISMILPAPTRRFVQMIQRCDHDLFISGDPIGGGGIRTALTNHLRKGFQVTMTEDAAYTLRNNLEQVREYGIIIDDRSSAYPFLNGAMQFTEFDWPYVQPFLSFFGEAGTFDCVAVAVQDHGVPPESISNRAFRFSMIEQRLQEDNRLESFIYTSDGIPSCYKRMKAVARTACLSCNCAVVAMDTCFAAILGCLEDKTSAIAVNVGNSHTIAATVVDGMLTGLLEHHTGCLSGEKLDLLLERFINGAITSEEVLYDGGHGVTILDTGGIDADQPIIATGPKRNLLKKSRLHIHYAAPHGNMMLTGPFGLVKGAYYIYTESKKAESGRNA